MTDLSGTELASEGLARHRDGDYAAAMTAYERAHAAYVRDGDPAGAARSARTVAWFRGWIFGEWAVHRGWTNRAQRLLEENAGDPRHQGWLMLEEARGGGDLEAQRSRYATTIELARRNGDGDLECEARASLGMMLVFSGLVEEGMAQLDEALAGICAGAVDELPVLEGCLCGLFNACERTHDVGRAEEWLRAAGTVITQRNLVAVAGYCRAHYAGVLVSAGRWAEAESELASVIHSLPEGLSVRSGALCRLADLRVRQGRFEEAAALLQGLEHNEDAVGPLVSLHLARGEPVLALELLDRASAGRAEDHVEAPRLASAVAARLALGDVEHAAATSERLCWLADRQSSPYIKGLAALAEAAVEDALDGAPASHLYRAVSHFTEARTPFEAARARLQLARAVAADRPGAAIVEASGALRTFVDVGAARDAHAAAAVLRSLGAPARTGPKTGQELTRREHEVLELLGLGLSNSEIAGRLYISSKTVEHHVGRILAKLGLRNRAAAAVHAVRTAKPGGT